ncbi:MAG: hypothetical protein GAK30_01357 [Paracidovorax wautersii]|uniref:DUF2622 domain-containing protein n=1 Tax=Paracidovorax wautersii TaxID=1177982 RepID=A0A7V8FQ49_9BURK|nr:MAG: hypothetical protein GAK30_01357 [Paracidovorax wautersii]
MADYVIRVVLHDQASEADYETLRTQLATRGVVDYVQTTDSKWCRLPPAEFVYKGPENVTQVRDAIYTLATQIKRSTVFVTISGGSAFLGLEQIAEPVSTVPS